MTREEMKANVAEQKSRYSSAQARLAALGLPPMRGCAYYHPTHSDGYLDVTFEDLLRLVEAVEQKFSTAQDAERAACRHCAAEPFPGSPCARHSGT